MNIKNKKIIEFIFHNLALYTLIFFSSFVQSQNVKKEIDSLERLLPSSKSYIDKIDILFNLSKKYQKVSILQSDKYNKDLLALSVDKKYKLGYGYFYLNSSFINFAKGNYDKSVFYAIKSKKIFKNKNKQDYFLDATYFHAFALNILNRKEEALKLVLNEIRDKRNGKYHQQLGQLNYFLGYYYFSLNDINNAIRYDLKALEFYRKANNEFGILKCYYNMSDIYLKTNQIDKAEFYAISCLSILEKSQNEISEMLSGVYGTLAEINLEKKQFKKAQFYCDKAIEINEDLEKNDYVALDLIISMRIDFQLNHTDKIIPKAKRVLKISKTNYNTIFGNYFLGVAYNNKKQYSTGYFYLNKAISLIDENEKNNFKQVFKEISISQRNLGLYQLAIENMELFHKLEIGQYNEEKEHRINELQTKFDVNEKTLALKVAKIEEQKQELKIQKNKTFTSFLGFLIFSIGTALLMLTLAYRNNHKKNLLLQIEKDKVSKSLSERELLLKEIHHRVKNNLQIVMSLLSIQAKEGNKANIGDFLEKSQSRIASISLIHQSLYENDRLDVIDYSFYLKEFVENLKNIIDCNSKEISFIFNVKDIFLDIQTAIPLSLIINELISNTFKHAFPNKSCGTITVNINKVSNEEYSLYYFDNGVGMNLDKMNPKSLGLDLVRQLAKQLKGKVLISNSSGFEVLISFSEFKY